MTTDRELLELAAKAAGIRCDGFDEAEGCEVWFVPELSRYTNWNPLTDDGDALRLAVKLQISVLQMGATRLCEDVTGAYLADEADAQGNGLSATRRAIVRAAAAIGAK